jgi:D-threo-aldose 1-dehydrogenase
VNATYKGERDNDLFEVPATHSRKLDYSRDGVLRSIDASLERLGLDRIDIAYVHDPDEHLVESLEGAFPALDELRREGAIRGYGAGMNQSAALAYYIRNTDSNVMMLAGRYTLLDQSAVEDLLPLARQRRVEVIGAGIFNSGILAGSKPPEHPRYNYVDAPAAIVEQAWAISRICDEHSVALRTAAANFPFTSPAVSAVVLGADNATQARQNAALLTQNVPEALWHDLELAGLIGRDVRLEQE